MTLSLHEFHGVLNAVFGEVNGAEVVLHYGDWMAEHSALVGSAGVMDLSFRGRICVTGSDRVRWFNGQVSNNIKGLKTGTGCYAALVSGKGKMQGDFNAYVLPDELLLDFEPGYTSQVVQRLEAYIIADDAQLVDASGAYGLLSVQGPSSAEVVSRLGLDITLPAKPFELAAIKNPMLGDIYLTNQPRIGSVGYDIYAPTDSLGAIMDKLILACRELGGRACGWQALETARIEAGVPRFGADMDETNLVPESGIEARAISYSKGCYIGQEIIARIRTYGQVTKSLRGLMLKDSGAVLPAKGARLLRDGHEVGYITSATESPVLQKKIALGYVRKEVNQTGGELLWQGSDGAGGKVQIVETPFR